MKKRIMDMAENDVFCLSDSKDFQAPPYHKWITSQSEDKTYIASSDSLICFEGAYRLKEREVIGHIDETGKYVEAEK